MNAGYIRKENARWLWVAMAVLAITSSVFFISVLDADEDVGILTPYPIYGDDQEPSMYVTHYHYEYDEDGNLTSSETEDEIPIYEGSYSGGLGSDFVVGTTYTKTYRTQFWGLGEGWSNAYFHTVKPLTDSEIEILWNIIGNPYAGLKKMTNIAVTTASAAKVDGQCEITMYFKPTASGTFFFTIYIKSAASYSSTDYAEDYFIFSGSSTAPQYKLTLTDSKGNGSTQITKDEGTQLSLSEYNPSTVTGYTFDGWYSATSGGTKYTSYTFTADKTLYAQWSPISIRINFDAQGGTVSPSYMNVTYDSTFGTLPTPTKSGYTFGGWYTSSSGGTEVTSTKTVKLTSTTTLYAHWSPVTYTVTFKTDSSTTYQTKTWKTGDSAITLNDPSKTGYTFKGWYTSTSGGSKVTLPYTPTKNITLYAQWTANTYKVNLDAQGGTVSSSYKNVAYDSLFLQYLPTPTREGYQFDGWWTGDWIPSQITSSAKYGWTNDITLYAHWKSVSYTVTYSAMGGTVSPSTQTFSSGQSGLTLPTPTWDGHSFDGWYTLSNGGTKVTSPYIPDASRTLYAHWTSLIYTVKFISDGTTVATKTWSSGNTGIANQTTTKSGYDFVGWFTDPDNGTEISFPYTPSGSTMDINLYAHWTPKQITVSFSLVKDTQNNPPSISVTYGSTYGELPVAPQIDGYTFKGWYTSSSGGSAVTSSTSVTKTADHTLYAHWTPLTYVVTFVSDGTTVATKSYAYQAKYTNLPEPPAKDGYTFDGWYMTEDGSTKITSNTRVDILENTTFYARWTENAVEQYTITFISDGETVNTMTAEAGEQFRLDTLTKTGYDFSGWSDGTTTYAANDVYTVSTEATLTAQWTPKTFTITFDAQGGTVSPSSKSVTYDSTYPSLPTPSKGGFTFSHWQLPDGTTLTAGSAVKIESDTTVTAVYDSNPGVVTHTVIYYQGRDTNVQLTSETIQDGSTITYKSGYARQGYTFVKWVLSDGSDYNVNASVTSDLNLYGVYNAIPVPEPSGSIAYVVNDVDGLLIVTITLTAQNCTGADWDFGDGTAPSSAYDGEETTVNYTYGEPGTYHLVITLHNQSQVKELTMDIVVGDAPAFSISPAVIAAIIIAVIIIAALVVRVL